MSRILLHTQFGLPADPWADLQLDTADAARAGEMIAAAAASRLFVNILGPRGSGKSRAVWRALRRPGVQVVSPLRLDRERLHLGDIQSALIRDLSNETPKQSGEARSYQTRIVLGSAQQNGRVVLLLDDGHVLHHSTLRGLKRLREMSWLGLSPLLGVVLIGQSDPARDLPEVSLRADTLTFAGLTQGEASEAIQRALNGKRQVVSAEAAEALAASPRARNWLDLQALVDECLAEAAARGEKDITPAVAAAVVGDRKRQAPEAPAPSQADADAAVTDLLGKGRARKSA